MKHRTCSLKCPGTLVGKHWTKERLTRSTRQELNVSKGQVRMALPPCVAVTLFQSLSKVGGPHLVAAVRDPQWAFSAQSVKITANDKRCTCFIVSQYDCENRSLFIRNLSKFFIVNKIFLSLYFFLEIVQIFYNINKNVTLQN